MNIVTRNDHFRKIISIKYDQGKYFIVYMFYFNFPK